MNFSWAPRQRKLAKRVLKDFEVEALENSKTFDVHTWSDHREVNDFVDPIYEEYFSGRKAAIRKKHVKVVLLDLYVTWAEGVFQTISVHRSPNKYNAGTRYNELHISQLTIKVVDALKDAGLIDFQNGFIDREQKIGRTSRIWPTDVLVEMFKDVRFAPFDIGNHEDRLTVILRDKDPEDKKSKDVEYEPNPDTERMSDMLGRYNDLLAGTFIDIPTLGVSSVEEEKEGQTRKTAISQQNKFVRRIFNRKSFDCGGRFNGGWWQYCPKEWREHIFINDGPTNEVDFSGLHIAMLYAREGIVYWDEVGTDPYEITELDFLSDKNDSRKVVKLLTLMSLNASEPKSAYRAFRRNVSAGHEHKRLTDVQLGVVYDALVNKHPNIAHNFCADMGIRLMRDDSDITEIILTHFLDKRVPVLSVHDSYIVPLGAEDELIDTMHFAFEQVMGTPLGGKDNKAQKEKSSRREDLEAPLMAWMPYEGLVGQAVAEKAYMERINPSRSDRYIESWKLFREWLASKAATSDAKLNLIFDNHIRDYYFNLLWDEEDYIY